MVAEKSASRILVIEDLEDNYFILKSALVDKYNLTWSRSISEAMSVYNSDSEFDLILVDIGLPDGDGYQFCDWVRSSKKDSRTPIIFVTSQNSPESRITGFSIGGDDYISKPFNVIELKARIEAKLRRGQSQGELIKELNGVCINLKSQTAKIFENSKYEELNLTPSEFKILALLLAEPDRVFTRDEILNSVWGNEVYVYPRSVDTHVSKLRTKLRSKSSCIRSVHGVGYKLVSNVEDAQDAEPAQATNATKQLFLFSTN